jgi:L-arabinose isomerase
MTTALTTEAFEDYARMAGTELLVIDSTTTLRPLATASDAAYEPPASRPVTASSPARQTRTGAWNHEHVRENSLELGATRYATRDACRRRVARM